MEITDVKFYTDDDDDSSSPVLIADFERGYVSTNCGDSYYDYEISFDNFIKFADYIRGLKNETKK